MSQAAGSSAGGGANSVPGWIASGLLGLAIGAGATVLVMRNDHIEAVAAKEKEKQEAVAEALATTYAPSPGAPGGGGAGSGRGGGGPPMMGGGMGGGGMGGGGMGGGGGGGGKQALTALVGKLELLSRPDLKLHVELTAEQAKAIADKLGEFDNAEKMTGEEAQEGLNALEALLTPEQKDAMNAIGLPRGGGGGGRGGGGGGGRGAAGRPGGGGGPGGGGAPGGPGGPPGGPRGGGGPPAMGGMMPMMGGGGGNPDENPFTQEANQKRLRDLRSRLAPESAKPEEKPE